MKNDTNNQDSPTRQDGSKVGCSNLFSGEDVADEWQPIETAPHGDDVFLAYSPHGMGGFMFVACWNTDGELISMMTGDSISSKETPDQHNQPATHWRPLPKLPTGF